MPQSIRLLLYRIFLSIGSCLCSNRPYRVEYVQRVLFNLYLKRAQSRRLLPEVHALKLVAAHTTANTSRVLDFIQFPMSDDNSWMLTIRVKGDIAEKNLQSMSADQPRQFVTDFRNNAEQLGRIPNSYPHLTCSPSGWPCRDGRIDHEDDKSGSYNTVEDWHKYLVSICAPLKDHIDRTLIVEVHSRLYRVYVDLKSKS